MVFRLLAVSTAFVSALGSSDPSRAISIKEGCDEVQPGRNIETCEMKGEMDGSCVEVWRKKRCDCKDIQSHETFSVNYQDGKEQKGIISSDMLADICGNMGMRCSQHSKNLAMSASATNYGFDEFCNAAGIDAAGNPATVAAQSVAFMAERPLVAAAGALFAGFVLVVAATHCVRAKAVREYENEAMLA